MTQIYFSQTLSVQIMLRNALNIFQRRKTTIDKLNESSYD